MLLHKKVHHNLILPSNAIFDERGWNEIKTLLG
jgi:hypothetical protein